MNIRDISGQAWSTLLSSYLICDSCGIVDYDSGRMKVGYPCPKCKMPSKAGRLFFPSSVSYLVDLIQEFYFTKKDAMSQTPSGEDQTDKHQLAIIIFFCTLAEVLLKNFLDRILDKMRVAPTVKDRLFKDNLFVKQRIDNLFPALMKINFREASKQLDKEYIKVVDFCKSTTDARNMLIHTGKDYVIPPTMAEQCIDNIAILIKLFVDLHNKYVYELPEALDIRTRIEKELFENDEEALNNFKNYLKDEIEEFIKETLKAYEEWRKWDSKINDDEQKAYISAFIFNAINTLVISTKLFIRGYVVPSGNLVRIAMESCAMAILCSNKELSFFEQIKKDDFKASQSVSIVESNADKLGITKANFTEFKEHWKFYHNYSHATLLTISAQVSFSKGSVLYIGSMFDTEKIENYKKEFRERIHIIRNLDNIIKGIEDNLK